MVILTQAWGGCRETSAPGLRRDDWVRLVGSLIAGRGRLEGVLLRPLTSGREGSGALVPGSALYQSGCWCHAIRHASCWRGVLGCWVRFAQAGRGRDPGVAPRQGRGLTCGDSFTHNHERGPSVRMPCGAEPGPAVDRYLESLSVARRARFLIEMEWADGDRVRFARAGGFRSAWSSS